MREQRRKKKRSQHRRANHSLDCDSFWKMFRFAYWMLLFIGNFSISNRFFILVHCLPLCTYTHAVHYTLHIHSNTNFAISLFCFWQCNAERISFWIYWIQDQGLDANKASLNRFRCVVHCRQPSCGFFFFHSFNRKCACRITTYCLASPKKICKEIIVLSRFVVRRNNVCIKIYKEMEIPYLRMEFFFNYISKAQTDLDFLFRTMGNFRCSGEPGHSMHCTLHKSEIVA